MIKRYVFLILILIILVLVKGYPLNSEKIEWGIEKEEGKELKFILIGDPQINLTTGDGIERLKKVVEYVNGTDVDFVVFLGDMTDDGKEKSNDVVKSILKSFNKPYYVIAGNHDIKNSSKVFESYYGTMEHIEHIKGYQLIFVGIKLNGKNKNLDGKEERLNWSFDFTKADRNLPTLVFVHGPVISVRGCIYCLFQEENIYYAEDIKFELEKFTNLIGVYSGHAHYDSNSFFKNTRYVTVNGLVSLKIFGLSVVRPSNYVGYSIINNNKSYYQLRDYVNSRQSR